MAQKVFETKGIAGGFLLLVRRKGRVKGQCRQKCRLATIGGLQQESGTFTPKKDVRKKQGVMPQVLRRSTIGEKRKRPARKREGQLST